MSRALSMFLGTLVLTACGSEASGPNVILISVDTLRRDALYAHEPEALPLPNLDRFADECVRYENGLSVASWTLPAHASLLTGVYPDVHGATDRRVTLSGEIGTLSEALAARGYETAAFTGGGFLDAKYGLGRGFQRYEAKTHGKQEPAEDMQGLLGRVRGFFAERGQSARPLFLFLHTYAVHNYYDARAEAAELAEVDAPRGRKQYVDCVLGRQACGVESWHELERLYRAELELFDQGFGELLEELETAGVWQDALVILVSDHGEGFEPERARIHHGGRLHADQLAIPFLVRASLVAARTESGRVSLVDVLPTVLDFVGAPLPAGLDGRSLVPNLQGAEPLAPRALLAMEHYFSWQDGKRATAEEIKLLPLELAVIDEDGWYITGAGADQLYAPLDGPQRSNASSAGRAADFRARLGARPFPRPDTAPAEKDEALDTSLDVLGYGGAKDE
jgi:arylsulfatase A-like enzyme